jgi:hypothetical protein
LARYHGLTNETYKRFVVDAGAVYKNYGETDEALIGATRDGNTFTIEQEIKEIAVDGQKGPVKGLRRVTRVVARITANFVEFTTDILKLALPGSTVEDYPEEEPTHDEIKRALQIALSDYCDNIALVGNKSGTDEPIICGIKNALADGNFEVSESDGEEATISIQFTAHFDPEDLDEEPWFIRNPKEIETVDAKLTGIEITAEKDGAVISIGGFNKDTHYYTASVADVEVAGDNDTVSLTVTTKSPEAAITVTLNDETVDPSNGAYSLELSEGQNVVVITSVVGAKSEVYVLGITYTPTQGT